MRRRHWMKTHNLAEMSREQMLDFLEDNGVNLGFFFNMTDEKIRDYIIENYALECLDIHSEVAGIAFPGIFSSNPPLELEE